MKGVSSDEVLIFGGHIDSTAPGMPTGRAPGADDDASGSAVVLEMFRILTSSGFVPAKTIEFHGYAAEEVGLRGSQEIAAAYRAAGKSVIGMVRKTDRQKERTIPVRKKERKITGKKERKIIGTVRKERKKERKKDISTKERKKDTGKKERKKDNR